MKKNFITFLIIMGFAVMALGSGDKKGGSSSSSSSNTCKIECDCLRKSGLADNECESHCKELREMGHRVCEISPRCCP